MTRIAVFIDTDPGQGNCMGCEFQMSEMEDSDNKHSPVEWTCAIWGEEKKRNHRIPQCIDAEMENEK